MRILFFSLSQIKSISEHGLYSDLLREFVKNNHDVTIISPVEKRTGKENELIVQENVHILRIKTGNIQKTNYIEKVISLAMLGRQLSKGIKKYCNDICFDCILYATPPITIYGLIRKLKMITGAKTVLMLKDIWPQEIVDLGIISKNGFAYRYLKKAERKMYGISDLIGYTSLANKRYLVKEGVQESKLIPVNNSVDANYAYEEKFELNELRGKYGIKDKDILFLYGGNLGRPQDIDYIVSCLDTQVNREGIYFIICGQGTEYGILEKFFTERKPQNMILVPFLPKKEYDQLIMSADVGMVFLNHRFTVPNCPTRFYGYMQYAKPVLACTDTATDIKNDIYDGDFGWWCESINPRVFAQLISQIKQEGKENLLLRGQRARSYLEEHYTVDKDYRVIVTALGIDEVKNVRI